LRAITRFWSRCGGRGAGSVGQRDWRLLIVSGRVFWDAGASGTVGVYILVCGVWGFGS
jgi:hypothetical protein